jgi:ABC-type sugar transport system substrate-binding protein
MVYRNARLPRAMTCALVGLMASASLVAAGCGSDDSSSSTDKASTGSGAATAQVSAGVKSAQEFVAAHSKSPYSDTIGDFEPMTKTVPKDVTIAGVDCGVPLCKLIVDGVKAASQEFGWKYQYLNQGSTPDSVTKTWNQLLQIKPKAIASVGVGTTLFKKQAETLVKGGSFHVGQGLTEPLGPAVNAIVSGIPSYSDRGAWMAKWVIGDGEGKGDTLYVNIADFPSVQVSMKAFKEEMAKDCSECNVTYIDQPASAIGKTIPQTVVSAIQRNPKIKYMVGAFGDVTTGVPEALTAAGLGGKVKIISANTTVNNLKNISQGKESASVGEGAQMTGWFMVDALARLVSGQPLTQSNYAAVPHQFITKDNIDQITDLGQPYVGVPGYQDQVKKLWKPAG